MQRKVLNMSHKEKEYSPEVVELVKQAKELAKEMRSKFTREEIVEQFKEFLDEQDELEKDELDHEIKMTDDKYYRDWYNKKKKEEDRDFYGIDEK